VGRGFALTEGEEITYPIVPHGTFQAEQETPASCPFHVAQFTNIYQ
jgi:hypothetical protein